MGMGGSERLDPKAGPLANLSQTYFGNLDMVVKGCEPALRGVGRLNLELVGLTAKRAQAWLEVPSRLGKCKTPADVFGEHVRFWQAAASDYAEGYHRLLAVWGACATMPKAEGMQPRDYITFAEPQEAATAAKRSERKAA
jgi:hypothetical protein